MQEITKKNLNREKLWNFRAWENGGNGDKEMSLPLFFIRSVVSLCREFAFADNNSLKWRFSKISL